MIHVLCALTVIEKDAECNVVVMFFSENRRHMCTLEQVASSPCFELD